MTIDMALARMTVAEKLQAMELIWADLSKEPASVPSPTWHNEILE